jgi:hypothetical protein
VPDKNSCKLTISLARVPYPSQHGHLHQQPQLQLLAGVVGPAAGVPAPALHLAGGKFQEPSPLPPLLGGPAVLYRLQDRPDGLHHGGRQPPKVKMSDAKAEDVKSAKGRMCLFINLYMGEDSESLFIIVEAMLS